MTAARLGYRTKQRKTIDNLSREVATLREENFKLKKKIEELEGKND